MPVNPRIQGQEKRVCRILPAHFKGNALLQGGMQAPKSTWPIVTLGIAVFVVQYWASGYLANKLPALQLLILLQTFALGFWGCFDGTVQGQNSKLMC